MVSQIQSVIFKRRYWTVTARAWLRKHKLVHDHKVDIKPNTLRFRQASPGKFQRFAIKRVKPSVDFVLGFF